jgi:hypothetical protein
MNVGWGNQVTSSGPQTPIAPAGGPKVPLAKELVESLRAEFHKLIDGDRFMENLVTIGNLSRHAYDLWRTLGVAPIASGSRPQQVGPNYIYGDSGEQMPMAMPISVSNLNPEQFGARSIREIIGLAPELMRTWANAHKNTAGAVVDAISKAKSLGLEDLATRLETKLMSMIEGDFEPEEEPELPEPHQHVQLPEIMNGVSP